MRRQVIGALIVGSLACASTPSRTVIQPSSPASLGLAQRAVDECPPVLQIKAESLSAHLNLEIQRAKTANVGATFTKKATAAVTNAAALGTYISAFGCRAGILLPASRDVADELQVEAARAWATVYNALGKGPGAMQDSSAAHQARLLRDIPSTSLAMAVPQNDVNKAFQADDLLQLRELRSDAAINLGAFAGGILRNASISLDAGAVQFAIQSLNGNTLLAAQQMPSKWRPFLSSGTSKRSLFISVIGSIYDIGAQIEGAP